jgi:hypothetical protein
VANRPSSTLNVPAPERLLVAGEVSGGDGPRAFGASVRQTAGTDAAMPAALAPVPPLPETDH